MVNQGSEALGVSISVDGETIVGTPSRDDVNRASDVDLESIDIQLKFDGLGAKRMLNVSTVPERRVHQPGELIEFLGSWNYPDWITKAEIRIYYPDANIENPVNDTPFHVIPVGADGRAFWIPGDEVTGDLLYTVRVYDSQGRHDETVALPIVISENAESLAPHSRKVGPAADDWNAGRFPGKGESRLGVSSIPIHGGLVTVYGRNLPNGLAASVLGRRVAVDANNAFVSQAILPPGEHVVDVVIWEEGGTRAIEFERDVNIPDNEWFYVGIADATFGRRTGSGSSRLVAAEPGEFDEVYRKGRLAFYLKGKMKGRYILTASLDTREEDLDTLFSNLDKKDPRHLLRRLDPDDYYAVYGDNSVTEEDAPTSGRFYVKIERGNSHVMWGNFKTRIDGVELARYERGLYGAHAVLEAERTTQYGDPVASLEAFAAQPGTLPQRDEFRGTGGSVYFLRRQDISQGSEQITVEIRDALTGIVVERRLLREGDDYTIDHLQGVLILREPLAASVTLGSAVLPSGIAAYDQYLVATYEYTPTVGDVDGYTFGGRAEAWAFDSVRFGVTGFQENTGMADQSLLGADVTWRIGRESYLQFEWARSEGDTFGQVVSTDGGLIFTPVSGAGSGGPAEAWRGRLHLDLGEMTSGSVEGSAGVGYEERDAGFNGPGRYTQWDERIIDAHLQIKPDEDTRITARYDDIERGNGTAQRDASLEAEVRVSEEYSIQAGVVHSDAENGGVAMDGNGARTDVGVRLTRHGFGEDKFYIFGQTTVARDSSRQRNDRVGAGFVADVTDKLRAEAEVSYGTSGIGALAALSYQPTASDRYYVGYRMLPAVNGADMLFYDPFGRDNGALVVGASRQMSDRFTAWTEHNFDLMGTSQGLVQAYGVEYTPTQAWTISAGLEAGTVRDENNADFDRFAPSIAVAYKEEDRMFSAKLEARFEDSTDDTRDATTWLAQAQLGFQHSDDWRFLAHLDAVISDSDQTSVRDADYIEASIGYAYRPVGNDRLNALFKYTYLHDLPAPEQLTDDGVPLGPMQRSHVVSADFIYDVTQRLSIGAKYGYRHGEISTTRDEADFMPSTAHLGVVRADYHVVKNWDLLLEGRMLKLSEQDQVMYGALAAVYRHIGNNMKLGVGYNFGRFSDDLTDLTLDDEGVFVNVIGKF